MKNQLDLKKVKKSALILRALNHKLRQEIMSIIDKNEKVIVTKIYTELRLPQPIVSQHLHILRVADIVKTERDGKFIYYSVNHNRLKEIETFVDQLLK